MAKTAAHSPAPWVFRKYAQDDAKIAEMQKVGMEPTLMLDNNGATFVMGATVDGHADRIAVVDCHTKFKRGEGFRAECAERDANARLIAAAPELFTLAKALVDDAAVIDGSEQNLMSIRDELFITACKLVAKVQP